MLERVFCLSLVSLSSLSISTPCLAQSAPTPQEIIAGWGGTDSRLDLNQDGVVNGADYTIAVSLQDSAANQLPTLEPGAGFSADTAEPPIQGLSTEPGYNARAIARWNFVPCQTMSSAFNIGVVAFHAYGINRVEFSLNGGPATSVSEPRLNPESGTVEYFVRIDPSQMATGEAEVRAVVYPNTGLCRVLAGSIRDADADRGEYGMFFVADPARSLPSVERFVSPLGSDTSGDGSASNPFKSIMKAAKSIALSCGGRADGGVINLLPGNHVYGTYTSSLATTTQQRWLTIRPAPGVASDQAPVVSATTGGLSVAHVRFHDVTFRPNGTTNTIILTTTSSTAPRFLWLDGCRLIGIGRTTPGDWTNSWQRRWVTNSFVTQSKNGFSGELVRGCIVDTIGSDAFTGSRLAVNSHVRKIDRTGTDFHPDFFQMYAPVGVTLENLIVYSCSMLEPSSAQCLFTGMAVSIKDVALVDLKVANNADTGFMYAMQFGGPTQHLLIQDCQVDGAARWRVDQQFTASDVVVRDTVFGSGPNPVPLAGVTLLEE